MFKPSPMKPMIRKENEKEKEQKIHVYIRTRPLNADEKRDRNGLMCLSVGANSKEVTIRTGASRTFVFDKVFGPDSSQMDIYKETVMGVLDEVLQGYNCTIFAYGQTGSGKTYTMEGQRSSGGSNWQDDPLAGIIPRTLHHLFDRLVDSNTEYTVRISYVELYNEELFDLLTGAEDTTRLRIYDDPMRKGSVIINGLSEVIVHNREEVYSILERGRTKRVTAATLLNANSSRSHSVFSITIHMRENTIDGEELLKIGKMYLVDLAGSENVGKSGAVDIRLREAGQINQSLLTLGRVITALTEHCPHVPYRESKLTRILQDSLGGRTKTSIIATVSPAFCNAEETLNTLDYASRAKNILNRPEINQRMTKKALLKEYTEEIEKLRKDLHAAREKHGIYIDTENYTAMTDQITAQEQTIQDISAKLEHITDQLTQQIALFESSQQRLEETEGHLCRTRNKLDTAHQKLLVDRENLQQTTTEREQLRYISEVYAENENVLYSQARELLRSCESLMQDLHQMHEHAERQRQREERNKAALAEHAASVPVLTEEMQTGVAGECRESSRLCVEETRQIEKLATEILPKLLSNYDSTTTSTSNAMGELTHATHSKIESLCAQLMEAVKTGRVNQENVGTTMNAFCATETEAHAALSQAHEGTDHSIAKLNAKLVKDIGDQTHQLSSHVGHATNNHSALLVECQGAAQTHAERQNGKISAVCQRLDDMEAQMQKALASIQTIREDVKQIAVDTATNYENIESSTIDAVTSASELQDHIQTSLQKVSDVATTYGEDAERLLGKSRKKTKKALGEADARLEKLSSETQANTTMVLELFDTISDRTNELNVTSEQGMNKTNATFVNHVTALRASLSGSIEEATKRMDVQRQHIAQLEQHLQQLSGVVDEGTLALNQEVQNLLQEKYSFDKPSGKTPKRAPDASYPRKLNRTEAPEVLVDRFKETFVPPAVTTSFLEDSMMTSPARSNLSADSLDSGSSTSTLNANKENSEAPIRLRVEQIEKSKSRSKENIVAAVSSASSQEDLVQKGDSKLLKPKATGRGRKPARELGNKN